MTGSVESRLASVKRTCEAITSDVAIGPASYVDLAALAAAVLDLAACVDAPGPSPPTSNLFAAHCLSCGAIFVFVSKHRFDGLCPECDAELYPVTRNIVAGERLKLGDGHVAQVRGCPVAGLSRVSDIAECLAALYDLKRGGLCGAGMDQLQDALNALPEDGPWFELAERISAKE